LLLAEAYVLEVILNVQMDVAELEALLLQYLRMSVHVYNWLPVDNLRRQFLSRLLNCGGGSQIVD
jgi:hypothetical protein